MKEPRCACGRKVVPPKRKCAKCLDTSKFKVVEMRPSRKGANAVGTCAHKPSKSYTRRAKKQNPAIKGSRPEVAMSRWGYV